MAGFMHDNARPAFMSIALHGLIVAALIFATDFSLHKPHLDEQPLPVEATVVDSRIVRAALSAKQDAARAAQQQRLEQQQAQQQAKLLAQQQRAAQQHELQQQQAQQAEQQQRLQQQKLQQQQLQQRQVEQQRLAKQREHVAQVHAEAAAAAAASKRALEAAARQAEAKREALAKAAAQQRALAAKRLAAAKRAAAAQADLRRQIAAEEHAQQVASGPLADQYRAALQNRIIHAWLKPASARAGIDCLVEVTQVPGGDVTAAQVTKCNGDHAVRQSIENAVYRASPLPEPPDPALFHRQFVFEFKPDE